jgi:YfiH family protein
MLQHTFFGLVLWQFEQLAGFHTINHFVSGRHGGVSEGEIGTLNLGFRVADLPANVQENRRRIASALGIDPYQLIFPSQTHSDHVQLVTAQPLPETLTDTDALITNTPGLCISVMSADCVPILLYDPVKQAVGAVHAGWKGTVSKILTRTVEAMQEHFNTKATDLIAGIGPSISPQVYQVGTEVIAAVHEAFGLESELISRQDEEGRGYFNLWEANGTQLRKLGVKSSSIEISNICTYQNSHDFFSARKSAHRTGRFAAGIMLKKQV